MATLTADALANGADAPYWQGLIDGKPQLQRCGGCGTWHWPAVWRCGVCGGWNQVWEPIALKGEIYTWARTWHPFGGTEALPKPFVTLDLRDTFRWPDQDRWVDFFGTLSFESASKENSDNRRSHYGSKIAFG